VVHAAGQALAAGTPAPPGGGRRRWLPRAGAGLLAVGLAAGLVLGGAALLTPSTPDSAQGTVASGQSGVAGGGAGRPDGPAAGSSGELSTAIGRAQRQLERLPGDWPTWAGLGMAYVQQARLTADPSYYSRADGALRRSLAVRPDGNALALVGLGALAAARHDFPAALRYGEQAAALDPFSAAARGVTADALIELGRYDAAWVAVQQMVDLRPDTGSLARASYAAELRGDVTGARELLTEALEYAPSAADAGYALYYLGELAWNSGDLAGAADRYAEGLRRAPSYLPLLAGRAKVAAARGRLDSAVADYRTVVGRLPLPSYLTEYGDLLAARGDRAGAEQQYAVVRTAARLQAAAGVDVDLEQALFDADHGAPAAALRAARAEYAVRRSVVAEDTLAWALHVNGRSAEALPHAKAALRLGTRSALFRYHLGMISAAVGDGAGARRELATALRLNPHFSPLHAPRTRAELTRLGGAP